MTSPQPSKPLLIALEGPAGAGKTTLQQHLWQQFLTQGVSAECIPEFSESDFGKNLRDNAQYGQAKPDWTIGIGGTLAFLADKIKLIEATNESPPRTVWISDRFVTSQLVLSIREIDDDREKEITENIILLALEWSASRFSSESLIVFLEAPLEVLEKRLSSRIGRSLTPGQSLHLQEEIYRYARLSYLLKGWNKINVSSTIPIHLLSHQLVNTISSRWLN